MKKKYTLTEKEKKVLFGLTKYPNHSDKEIAKILSLNHSTVTSIRNRLREKDFFRKIIIPRMQNMGCQMLVAIYTNFSPLIPLEERVEITGKTIEVFDEVFFSIGEQDKGFSLSLSQDYATIGKINDVRTQTFGGRGLLEEEYPNMVVFPFDISKVYRFFDFAPLLRKNLDLKFFNDIDVGNIAFKVTENVVFSDTEKNVLCMLVNSPESSDSSIGRELGVSRHTVSRLRRNFENQSLIRRIVLPNIDKLGFEILSFYHIRFDPRNPPNLDSDQHISLLTDSSVFFACRMFEAVMISIYRDYDDYKRDRNNIMQILKENRWIAKDPIIRTYGLNTLVSIKDFKFAPITQKIVGCDFWVKKLLNM